MQFSFFQKFTSFLLLFFLLFSFTVRIPFLTFFGTQTYADEEQFYNLVSVIVDEEIYGQVKSKLVRYTQDIQGVLENTRVVILPTPSTATSLDIASLNEKLFFEGYKGVKDVNFESKLIGTVLVGDIPIPVLFDGNNSSRSLTPYIDFEEKTYIYDHESQRYEYDDDAPSSIEPEIWHGVISPNSGDITTDVDLIKGYFDKNHDFYTGEGNFETDAGIINGKNNQNIRDSYDPYVFYYDQFRETKALNYEKYEGYRAYLQNQEDIVYNRYTAELAAKIKDQVLGIQNENIKDLVEKAIPGFPTDGFSNGPDIDNTPDIQTRYITDNATNKFLEIFNEGTLADIRKYVHNAGRYNGQGSEVNVDMAPFLISVLDQVSSQVVKNINTNLEGQVDEIVQNGLARNIAIPVTRQTSESCGTTYTNFYYGRHANDVQTAADCSIYRGSLSGDGKLVEANRGINISLIQGDLNRCGPATRTDSNGKVTAGIQGYWGGNTPFNLKKESLGSSGFELDTHNLKGGIVPVFDIVGSTKETNSALVPSPLNCLQTNYILTQENRAQTNGEGIVTCSSYYSVPVNGQSAQRWNCSSVNRTGNFTDTFLSQYESIPHSPGGSCKLDILSLDGETVRMYSVAPSCRMEGGGGGGGREGGGEPARQVCTCPRGTSTYDYKEIPSYIEHKSPTNEEFGAQISALTSPALPVDKDRYIDFIAADGAYAKIDYPHLFRVTPTEGQELTLENIDSSLESHLDSISANINDIIVSGNPSSLGTTEQAIYNLLKSGDYPSANVDLHNDLKARPLQTFTIDGDSKEVSYYDTLVFAIYWNNLKTVSGKYKFIFENYLSDQFGGNDFLFNLPRNKKSYEVAYLGAPGDTQNMYIKLDPEQKGTNPYASIIAKNIALNTSLISSNVIDPTSQEEGVFKCAPPDGVPIWEWIPAVICRLQDMLPPTIGISEGSCGPSLLSEEEQEEILECQGDVNKNGISDCIEGKLLDGKLELLSDAEKYYYNSVGTLGAVIRDKNGAVVTLDSVSYVDFELTKLQIPDDSTQEFTTGNTKTIYDENDVNFSSQSDYELAQQYLNFRDTRSRAGQGKARTYFSAKRQDVNAQFVASLTTKDHNNDTQIYLESDPLDIQVRGDRLFLNSYLLEGGDAQDITPAVNTLKVSDAENVFLIDTNQKYVEDVSGEVFAANANPQKALLALTNYSKSGNVLSVDYPLTFQIKKDDKIIYEETDIEESDLANFKPLSAVQTSGRLNFVIKDASGYMANKTIDFIPEVASSLDVELGTTVSQTGGNLTTHIAKIQDKFGNITAGDIYEVEMSVSGGGLNFYDTKETSFVSKTVEGYKIFRLESTSREANNTLSFAVKNVSGDTLATTTKTLRTIDGITMSIVPTSGNIVVGGGLYDFDIELKDTSGNLLSDFDSRAYMVINPIYGKTPNAYVDIKNGKATMQLQTNTIAARDVKLEFQVEGMSSIVQEYIDILPEVPIKLDLSLSRDKIEASVDDVTYLYSVLKDRYGNEVFTDNTTDFSLEILPEYANIITSPDTTKKSKNGKAQFEIRGTDIPGIGYFKVSTSPSLDGNSFSLQGQAPFEKSKLVIPTMKNAEGLTDTGKLFFTEYNSSTYISKFTTQYRLESSQAYKDLPSVLKTQVTDFWKTTNQLVIHGVGENAGSVETFYFWNEENINGNKYNGIYSVLLGAPYGDVTQPGYLGGSLLFDSENRSLAVTSLINNPYKYSDIISVSQSGNLKNISGGGDITQDIRLRADFDAQNRMYVDIFNDALGTYVGKAYYNLGDTELVSCAANLNNCIPSDDTSTTIQITDSNFTLVERGDDLVLKNNFGSDSVVFYENGTIERKSSVYLEIDDTNASSYVRMNLKSGDDVIGYVVINIVGGNVNITRDQGLLENKLQTLANTLIVYLKTNQYGTRDIFEKNGNSRKVIFYNDPFGSKHVLDNFHDSDYEGLENFHEVKGLGWEEGNKSLLAFSAGESVGASTQKYFSFSLINLGDPVVDLQKIKRTFINAPSLEKSFDPTIGTLVSGDESIVGYQLFDYNNDDKDDIILAKTDGYIELLENKDIAGNYLNKGNLVHAVDGGPVRLVKTGNFTGDNYDDIFFVSDDGEPVIFNNHIKDFVRISLEEQFSLSGAIIQAEIFDMDNDTRDDIVTLDDAGQIHIFYGGGTAESPEFTKLKVGDGYGIKLSDTVLSRGGAVYFDELPQVGDEVNANQLITSNEEFQAELQNSVENGGEGPSGEFFNELLADRLLFVKLPYSPYIYDSSLSQQQNLIDSIDASIETTNYPELDQYIDDSETALENFINNNGRYIDYNNSYGQSKMSYFLRSEYADTQGLTIEKKFVDISPEFLQTGDLVEVEIRLKNTGSNTLNNVAFVDTIARNFALESQEVTVNSEGGKTITAKPGLGLYDLLIDGFFLAPGEEVVLSYMLKTLPLKYGYIQAGLFEEGELGDDEWGDIILKPNHLNCGEAADIYTSIAQRSYTKGKTTPTCDEDKLKLPEEIGKNALDDDGNGVPDYIDDLVGGSEENVLDYAQGVLDDMHQDSDSDGVPDSDDALPNTDENSTDIMSAIAEINGVVDEISEEIDNVIEGFSCGFGGGSCIATPLNWAPLAPGGDPTLFGMPIGDGLKVNEGIPVFSALTGLQMTCGHSPCCLPSVHPVSSLGYVPGPVCGAPSAGGSLGTWSPTNNIRLFATPTLTGGAGIAACFGGPAIVNGNIPPPGVHPIAPGGNCIVAAVPLFGCEGEEGDPTVTGNPWNYPQYGVINANCPAGVKDETVVPDEIDNSFVKEYLQYKETGVKTQSLVDKFKDAFSQVAEGGGNWNIPSGPLVNIGGGGDTDMSLSVDFDPSALSSGNFEDVVKVQNTRISPFPDFLMDWVTRQLEEVVNKLTNLPKIFVILPDFSGIFDYGWEDFNENLQTSFNSGKTDRQNEKNQYQGQIDGLQARKAALGDCTGDNASICSTIDAQINQLNQQKNFGSPETLSGIKAAYEFLGNVPLVAVEPEIINVNIPWIDAAALERVSLDWKFTIDQWKSELQRASGEWSFGKACNYTDSAQQARCERENEAGKKLNEDSQRLIGSLEKNLEIIEEYKQLPERLNELISIKEVRLEQILCNIEAISSLLGEWIDTNGERFKAWVELFVLIKSILKSWQLLIDVFQDYDEECHQCKNERQDLQTFLWKLISSVIPKLPIIQFPKWPDIILDLHNVRAGITLYLPDFEINLRPIVLPTLPSLELPDVPTLNLDLPELPLLPEFTIPELPELPSLPTVELPDLPPPPTIPKLFGAVEGILNIMKLVTKIMCIIKQSPFVPEWRAGDQIAYITERSGYLSFDFIDISLPQFSYPFVDAIKVTTYVNFEFETEFILEAVRQVTAPLDTFTNDISNMFQIQVPDVDFSGAVPDSIDIDLDIDIDGEIELEGPSEVSQLKGTQKGFELLAVLFASKIQDLIIYVESEKDVLLTNKEFIAFVNENLASKAVTENPRMNEIRHIWEEVNNMTYSKEDKIIEALQENRKSKFEELGNIITTEIQNTKDLKKEIKNIGQDDYITKVAFENKSDIDAYNTRLESYNKKLVDSAINLVNGGEENKKYQQEISTAGEALKNEIRGGLSSYAQDLKNPPLLADSTSTASGGEATSCSYSGDSYKYTYEGLYVLEFDRHYRLFEYLDELRGDEYVTPTDVDSDGDDDLLYMMNNQLFLKENLKNADTKEYVSLPPLILNSGDNTFYNGDIYYEAVNGFEEANISDSFINVRFKTPTDSALDNFRMEFYTIVDKFRNLGDEDYIPTPVKKFVVDAVADIEENTLIEETSEYTLGKHVAYISHAGVIPGAKLTNTKLINIRDDLASNNIVTLTNGSKLSAGGNSFTIEYYTDNPDETTSLNVPKYSYVSFPSLTYIVGLSGDAYVPSSILEDIEGSGIVGHIGKPLFPGAKITYSGNDAILTEASHIDITHADGSTIALHMRDVDNYRLYDLGENEDEHLIRLKVKNDFYYAKIYAFKDSINSTVSQQILLSPQTQADTEPPQIGLNQKIRIPVYQKKIFDFTPYIYEDSGIDNIVDVKIDFDFTVDADEDGDARNDRDTQNINILQTPTTIKVEFGEYETLFERQIRLFLTDGNGNVGFKDIDFQVYPPAPQIQDYEDETIKGVIDETLLDEPVRIYRVRGGAIKKLENTQGTDLVDTSSDGTYDFGVPETSSGLRLQKDGADIATIDEYTGKITLGNAVADISMLASNNPLNAEGFPRIAINYLGEEVFYEYIQPKYDSEIEIITSVDEIQEEGIYVRIIDQELYNSFTVPVGVSFNPGAVILYLATDEDKEAVFSVFRDGRVYSGDIARYTLKYQSIGDRSTYILHDTLSQTDIAQVILDIEASYILK